MSRLFTTGFEIGIGTTTNGTLDGKGDFGSPIRVSTTVRTGGWALRSQGNDIWAVSSLTQNNGLYTRAYIRFSGLPAATLGIIQIRNDLSVKASVRLTTTGTLQLWAGDTPAQIGSDSAALVANTWYRVELFGNWNSVTNSQSTATLRLNDTEVATSSAIQMGGTLNQYLLGWTAAGATQDLFFDDVAVNDGATATSQNSWPGDGKVALLVPTGDNSVGAGWEKPGGATTNLYTSVDNSPPAGVADSTNAAQAENQIRNATANLLAYAANMTTYTAAGLVAGDTITALLAIAVTAAPVSTSAKTGSLTLSNPTIAKTSFGTFYAGSVAGTWGTGWITRQSAIQYAPAPTFATAPVLTVTQDVSSTRIAMISFMGIYVDYAPAAIGAIFAPYIGGGYYP